jgi:hypothetical protein
VKPRNADLMTPGERLVEIGEIVLAGYRRLRAKDLRSAVAARGRCTAPCDDAVNSREKGVA